MTQQPRQTRVVKHYTRHMTQRRRLRQELEYAIGLLEIYMPYQGNQEQWACVHEMRKLLREVKHG